MAVVFAALFTVPLLAGEFSGTYRFTSDTGGMVLSIQHLDADTISGTLTMPGHGITLQVSGQRKPGDQGILATAIDTQRGGGMYLALKPEGNTMKVGFVEPGAEGQPDFTTLRESVFQRESATGQGH